MPADRSRHPQAADAVLRSAEAADALCLSVLAIQVFLDTYATDGIRPSLAHEVLSTYAEPAMADAIDTAASPIVVAELHGHLIGFAQLTLGGRHELLPDGQPSELLRLYVQEPFSNSGIGTRLLAQAESVAAAHGATVLWLTAWVHNHRALRFYARRGYIDVGRTTFVFEGESHDNRVLARQLLETATP